MKSESGSVWGWGDEKEEGRGREQRAEKGGGWSGEESKRLCPCADGEGGRARGEGRGGREREEVGGVDELVGGGGEREALTPIRVRK